MILYIVSLSRILIGHLANYWVYLQVGVSKIFSEISTCMQNYYDV